MNSPPQSCIGRIVTRVVSAGMVAAALLPAVAHAQIQTWGGGSGNWFGNANWSSSAGSGLVWTSTTPRAFFTAGSGTLTLNGSVTLDTSSSGTNSSGSGSGMNFLQSGTWTLSSGTVLGRAWALGASGSSTIKLTLDNVALNAATEATFSAFNTSQVEIVLGNLANSTTPLLSTPAGPVSFTVGADTNFGSIKTFRPNQVTGAGFSATGNNPFFSGTLAASAFTFTSNGHTFSAATVANVTNSPVRTLTITGTGGIAAGTFLASSASGTHTVWTKAGTGFLSMDSLVTTGTQDFIVSAGSMLFNGTSTDLGNVNVASGAILGGTGSLSFAAGKVVTGSAGSIFTADMTAGGLDIAGTLALAQTGSGVTLRLSGLLPTSGTTTLMSWTTLSTGSFTRITYNDTEVFPDIATPTLGGGKVSYNTVENAIVFIAVPEPAAVCLLAGGAALLGGLASRRCRPAKPLASLRDS
jgi:hypothetical protein